jgi:hypothetical protein
MRLFRIVALTAGLGLGAGTAPAQVLPGKVDSPAPVWTPTTPADFESIANGITPEELRILPPVDPSKLTGSDDVGMHSIAVPEPGAMLLTGAAIVWAAGSYRRRGAKPVE